MVIVLAPTVDGYWLLGEAHKTIFDVEHVYRWYRAIIDDDVGLTADVLTRVVEDLNEIYAQ